MHDIQEFLTHYRRQRRWTRELVEAIPPEHFDWAPLPESFTCGDLLRHLIQAEIFWCRLITKAAAGEAYDPFELQGDSAARLAAFRKPNLEGSHDPKYGTTFAEGLARWAVVAQRTADELAKLAPEHLAQTGKHPLTGLEAPLWELLIIMVEHEAHHRGQLSAYLKILGEDQPVDLWS